MSNDLVYRLKYNRLIRQGVSPAQAKVLIGNWF